MFQDTNLPNEPNVERTAGDSPQPGSRLSSVRVEVQLPPHTVRTIKFPPNARALIGRSEDEEAASDLMLDFAPYGGEPNGVSRIHAAISDQEGQVFITDLNSTNGTRINGLELVVQRPYRLYEGDELELGSVRLTIIRISRS